MTVKFDTGGEHYRWTGQERKYFRLRMAERSYRQEHKQMIHREKKILGEWQHPTVCDRMLPRAAQPCAPSRSRFTRNGRGLVAVVVIVDELIAAAEVFWRRHTIITAGQIRLGATALRP